MPSSAKTQARIRLTGEQIEAIRQQTGVARVPEYVAFSVAALVDRQSIEWGPAATQPPSQDGAGGLIHERNRI